jgi:hypothetical protein
MPRAETDREISDFKKRLAWIVANFDTDPRYARFCTKIDDVDAALRRAIKAGTFTVAAGEGAMAWSRAKAGLVAKVYVDWLLRLYPDLTKPQITARTFKEFVARGTAMQEARRRWRRPITFVAKHRRAVADFGKRFYASVDEARALAPALPDFPLVVKKEWIRASPLRLDARTETPWLKAPAPTLRHAAPRLPGLKGDYATYKDSLADTTRRAAITEPQYDGRTFCASAVKFDACGQFIGFDYYLSRYFDFVNTCEILGAELADARLKGALPARFPLRGAPADIFDFPCRAAYPGVNCVTLFLNHSLPGLPGPADRFLLQLRDETQSQAQNMVHILPAGGHQPLSRRAARADTAIRQTVVRELLEELFDVERHYRGADIPENFFEIAEVKKLTSALFSEDDPSARIYLLGFGLDPVTTKPEVLVCIVIDWARVRRRIARPKLRFNWEVRSRAADKPRHRWVTLSRAELMRQAKGRVQALENGVLLDTFPAAAACMQLTAAHLDEILDDFRRAARNRGT